MAKTGKQSWGEVLVASDRGYLREVVMEGETGSLVQPDDAGAIVERLTALAQDRTGCARLGQAARRRYEAGYDAARYVRRMVELFVAAAGRREVSDA